MGAARHQAEDLGQGDRLRAAGAAGRGKGGGGDGDGAGAGGKGGCSGVRRSQEGEGVGGTGGGRAAGCAVWHDSGKVWGLVWPPRSQVVCGHAGLRCPADVPPCRATRAHTRTHEPTAPPGSRSPLLPPQEIYGMEQNKAGGSGEGYEDVDGNECVICMSAPRDTTALPCRHMCMCHGCASALKTQTNKCPICRNEIESLLHIKINNKSPAPGAPGQAAA